ncbi:hypothetical protein HK100_005507 [Physocladia obscura]|uniref:Uncharacterized protein n=1 Tax=Physocladia obscura TaxID=109957 RepID=A0AAD5XC97_9FUNG|nr:hypothetical protein HK100_005507 [Physocladia obscura]
MLKTLPPQQPPLSLPLIRHSHVLLSTPLDYRKSTTIVDAAISLREDALIDSLLTLPRFNLPASATSTSTPLLFLFTSTHDGPVMDFDFAAYTPRHSNATNTLPYTLVPIRISNLIESTQSSHSVFISSLPLTGAAGALLAPVVAGLDPLAHVGTYENVLGESVRALAAALEDLVKSEADVVELRKRALEKRKRKEVAVEASISTVDENKIDGGFRSFF